MGIGLLKYCSVALNKLSANTVRTLFYLLHTTMNRLFSGRFAPFDQSDNVSPTSYFEHLFTNAGVDMPELIPHAARDQIILESREALLARLTSNQQDQVQSVQDGTAAYSAMMTRIESSELSPSLAAEFDDYMNLGITVQNSNNT